MTVVTTRRCSASLYPLAVTGLAQVLFRDKANGQLVERNGDRSIGSRIIGQAFTSPGYFHGAPVGRPARGYDAANSAGTNLGPTNKKTDRRGRPAERASGRERRRIPGRLPRAVSRGADRPRDHLGVRARSAPVAGRGAVPGAARRARARSAARTTCALRQRHTEGRQWGFSASRASTCCC